MNHSLRFSEALMLLLQAYGYAQELQRSPWAFALELEALRETGLNHSDCRWLVYKNYLLHAVDASPSREDESARCAGRLVLTGASCFILTAQGIAFAHAVLGLGCPPAFPDPPQAPELEHPDLVAAPRWDKDRRELWLGTALIKQFKVPAANQETILAAFQEEQWPICLDDPLPPPTGD